MISFFMELEVLTQTIIFLFHNLLCDMRLLVFISFIVNLLATREELNRLIMMSIRSCKLTLPILQMFLSRNLSTVLPHNLLVLIVVPHEIYKICFREVKVSILRREMMILAQNSRKEILCVCNAKFMARIVTLLTSVFNWVTFFKDVIITNW